jgi:hypothetical protein
MGSHGPLKIYNTSYGWKKSQESKCQFDSQPLKIGNHIKLCVYRWHATYCSKAIDECNNFALDLTSIGGLHKKIWASKVLWDLILRILGLPTWESWDKMTFGCSPHGYHKKYYKREGGSFPQVRAMVSLMGMCMPMVHPCIKNVPTMH